MKYIDSTVSSSLCILRPLDKWMPELDTTKKAYVWPTEQYVKKGSHFPCKWQVEEGRLAYYAILDVYIAIRDSGPFRSRHGWLAVNYRYFHIKNKAFSYNHSTTGPPPSLLPRPRTFYQKFIVWFFQLNLNDWLVPSFFWILTVRMSKEHNKLQT